MDSKKLWESVLVDVEINVSKASFNTWFKDTFIYKLEDGVAYLSVPNAFVKQWMVDKYHGSILKSLRALSENIRSLDYIVNKSDVKREDQKIIKNIPESAGELPLSEFYINKDDNLNPKYTFDSFVIGPFNELAHAAAQAIIKKPGIVYNPLFIYGNTGHGKTHLIQAVGNYMKQNYPDSKIHYVTSEKFTVDYVNSVQNHKVNNFKEKYRKYDVLIMDDIQFFSNKQNTQEELFHLFNHLYENNKQIIFSSDKHPNYIQNLEDRLKSRFAAGMIVDIPAPDHESRTAILKAKLRFHNHVLSLEIIDYLAQTLSSNIRELEGALNTIICQARLKQKELTLNDVKNLIKNSASPKRNLSPKEIIKIIADFYNINEENIYEKTRKKEIIKPRQITMYILREDFNISYPSIGEKMGGRDHTTVIHSCEKIKNDLKFDSVLSQEINRIRAMLI
ncbi:chromosomal replication initiator protein DnaA [Candidatus Parcubacteria bacterium]|nr:chromosomal replication initiator protein DnaA [Candidatus Parcubacteria bacterium]